MLSTCFFGLAMICFFIGAFQLLVSLLSGQTEPVRASRPARSAQSGFEPIRPGAPGYRPRPTTSPARAEQMAQDLGVSPVNLSLQKFDHVKLDDRLTVRHPVRGDLTVQVQGRIVYAELWQATRNPQAPWVPTGNAFAGFWLSTDMFLLNWQNRLYLLDEREELSDAQIARDFAPHARKFAQSDQTADVYFAYPPATWHIDDIGKFRIETVEGTSARFRAGAVGRFIHASGQGGRGLVVEDYEGAGGQDAAWVGYLIEEEAVKK